MYGEKLFSGLKVTTGCEIRTPFRLLVHESEGQKYEDLFVKIMSYSDPGFRPVKAYGYWRSGQ